MKKKKLIKKLDLGKKQISNLGNAKGGAEASHISCTVGGGNCTSELIKTCTWYSELYTACTCPPSWDGCAPSINIPCPGTIDLACQLESVRICVA